MTQVSTPGSLRARFLESVRQSEGFSSAPYCDNLGNWTVGYGHELTGNPGKGEFHPTFLKRLFEQDIKKAEHEATYLTRFWTAPARTYPPVWYTVVEMCFVLGQQGALNFHEALSAMRDGDMDAACAALKDSKWYTEAPHRVEKLCTRLSTGEI